MGEKNKLKWDIQCPYCGKKYLVKEMKELGYLDKTKIGEVAFCENPKCEQQWLINE